MGASTILKDVMKSERVTLVELSKRAGYSFYTALQKRLSPDNDIRSSVLVRLADCMGYDVVLRKRDRTREFVIPVEDSGAEE